MATLSCGQIGGYSWAEKSTRRYAMAKYIKKLEVAKETTG
jgi:hypothetical protein